MADLLLSEDRISFAGLNKRPMVYFKLKKERDQNISYLEINEDTFLLNTIYPKLSLLNEPFIEGSVIVVCFV